VAEESYQIVFKLGDEERQVDMDRPEIVMGRGPECQVQLSDYSISRQHAKLVRKEDEVVVVDLGSRNGTRVNGAAITQAAVTDGDEIILGKFPVHFRRALKDKVVLSEGKPVEAGGATIIRSVNELQQLVPGLLDKPAPGAGATVATPARDLAAIEKSNRILLALSKMGRDLMATKSVDELLEKVMNLIFEHIPAERGYMLLREEEGKDLVPKLVKHRDEAKRDEKGVTISRTIVDKVLKEKVALYSLDAGTEFGTESIAAAKIRSFMSAPLWNQDRVIGLVHLDSSNLSQFTPSELDLLSAIANYAAVGIEQARLNRRIQEEQKSKAKLERYHSAAVIKRILASTGDGSSANFSLEVQEIDCSILFCDVVGFTAMSEHMEPRQVALVLNDFFSRMTEMIFEYEGTLDKYIGDEIMAVFGAPIPHADHATRAVKAALAMRKAQLEANKSRVPEARLQFRAAINSGRVVAGDIGSIKRMDYTVLGNAVNVASRLVKATPDANKIIIGDSTYNQIKDQFKVSSLGTRKLKGLREEMNVYEILD